MLIIILLDKMSETQPLLNDIKRGEIQINENPNDNQVIINIPRIHETSENSGSSENSESSESSESSGFVSTQSSEYSCWICKESMTLEEKQKFCNCVDYEMGFVHYDCLNNWVNTSHKTHCDFCQQEYRYEYQVSWKIFFLKIFGINHFTKTIVMIFVIGSFIYTLIPNEYMYAENDYQILAVLLGIAILLEYNYKYLSKIYQISKVLTLMTLD